MRQGLFITLEGVDGVGKTTQALILKEYFEQLGYEVLHTFEPGGTKLGNSIRQILLNPQHEELHSMTEILLYASDRAQHVYEVILPALNAKKIVICDRYVDSSIAYQGYGLGLEIRAIEAVNQWATGGLIPDRTIYLDADPALSLQKTEGDRIEQRTLEYYARVRKGFLTIAQREPERFKVISADGTREAVADRIIKALGGIYL
ncbi:MAG: dTMP kinase [Bacillota bacterium]|nr:dTMP kinase [Bacillota bacterium]HHU60509.1 dTMP kinase [Natronincola sp.]